MQQRSGSAHFRRTLPALRPVARPFRPASRPRPVIRSRGRKRRRRGRRSSSVRRNIALGVEHCGLAPWNARVGLSDRTQIAYAYPYPYAPTAAGNRIRRAAVEISGSDQAQLRQHRPPHRAAFDHDVDFQILGADSQCERRSASSSLHFASGDPCGSGRRRSLARVPLLAADLGYRKALTGHAVCDGGHRADRDRGSRWKRLHGTVCRPSARFGKILLASPKRLVMLSTT